MRTEEALRSEDELRVRARLAEHYAHNSRQIVGVLCLLVRGIHYNRTANGIAKFQHRIEQGKSTR
jgi:hypothetical protein